MVGWREQHFLQAHTTPVDFGFSQPLDVQWSGAGSWLAADPRHRWVFFDAAVAPGCIDQARTISVGASNRRDWLVARGDAWRAGCTVDAR
jgi:hypothetical protein